MHLYMYSEFSKEVADITLKDGCWPAVGDQISEQLEPAIWFKVLVLDAISIDCNKRHVLWHTSTDIHALKDIIIKENAEDHDQGDDSDIPKGNGVVLRREGSRRVLRRRISESIYNGGECFSYSNDMDEVFELTQDALSRFVSGQLSQKNFNKEIFRLLHIHILPNIRLSVDDVMNVETAMAIVEGFISDIGSLMMEKQDRIDSVMNAMERQRLKFIQDMGDPDFSASKVFSLPMAELLHKQINDDIRQAHEKLEDMTKKVEVAKEFIMSSGESQASASSVSSGDNELIRLRNERDEFVVENFNRLLTARAVLDDYIKSSLPDPEAGVSGSRNSKIVRGKSKSKEKEKKSKKSKNKKAHIPQDESNSLHATYLGMQQTCDELLKEMQEIASKKVLVTSVRESIRGVLEILLQGKTTSGVEIDVTGTQRPTDVMRHSQIPLEWLSLAEQVSSIIQDEKLPIAQKYSAFCESVTRKCYAALQGRKLSILSDSIRDSNTPNLSPTRNGGLYAENKLYQKLHGGSPSECSSGISSARYSESSNSIVSDLSKSGNFGGSVVVHSKCDESSYLTGNISGTDSSSCEVLSLNADGSRSSRSSDRSRIVTSTSMPLKFEDSLDSNSNYSIIETDDSIILTTPDQNDLERVIEWIKSSINEHFEKICSTLENQLGYSGSVYFRKIWQCYETHFFAETMDVLSQLYVEAYSSKTKHVLDRLSFLTAKDLDLTGFILNILQDVDQGFPGPHIGLTSDVPDNMNPRESVISHDTSSDQDSQSTLSRATAQELTSSACSERTLTPTSSSDGGSQECPMPQNYSGSVSPDGHSFVSEEGGNSVIHEISKAPSENDPMSPNVSQSVSSQHNLSNVQSQETYPAKVSEQLKLVHMNKHSNVPSEETNELIVGHQPEKEPIDHSSPHIGPISTCPDVSLLTDRASKTLSLDHRHPSFTSDSLKKRDSAGTGSKSSASTNTTSSSKDTVDSTSSSSQSLDSKTESSDSPSQSSENISPKTIKIDQPTPTTVVYRGFQWPPVNPEQAEDTSAGSNAVSGYMPTRVAYLNNLLSPTEFARVKTTHFQPAFMPTFSEAFGLIDETLIDSSPLLKLQHLVQCLKSISSVFQELQTQYCGKSLGACADDLIDILVIFLCNVQADKVQKLYAQIMLLSDLLPQFFEGGPFSFTLVQFAAAFQVLQDRLIMKTKLSLRASKESFV